VAGMWDRFISRRRLGRQVSLWYHSRYEAPSLAKLANSLGMIALRGKRVLAQLAVEGLVKPGDLHPFPLVSLSDLGGFHGAAYLEKVRQKDTLSRIFGLPEHEINVDEVLGAVRWAVSGTLAATRSVLEGSAPLAINLGGGFHHAEPNLGAGFCVFNDIGVAIRKVRAAGFRKNILIVDLDFHQGNGNIVGFLNDATVRTYSLHGAIWTSAESAANYNRNFENPVGDEAYLAALQESLPGFLADTDPGLAFFIAGHDVLEKDPLGTFNLTLVGTERRDEMILNLLQERQIPTVVTLGGGYSPQSCQATLNLAGIALGVSEPLTLTEDAEFSARFRKVLADIDPYDSQFRPQDSLVLSDADLWPDLDPSATSGVLKKYTAYELEREMEDRGILEKFRNLGYEDFRVTLEATDPQHALIRVEARPVGKITSPFLPMTEIAFGKDFQPAWGANAARP